MHLVKLLDPSSHLMRGAVTAHGVVLHRVDSAETEAAAYGFLDSRTTRVGLVALAYRDLEEQTDRQYARLTDESGPYRFKVVSTRIPDPYADSNELIAAVRSTRTLEVPAIVADRRHPVLGNEPHGAYDRLRAVHDLVGHVGTGYGFDPDGEYSAWLMQRTFYSGLARWAASTELHAEVSVLWATGQYAEHKATLIRPEILLAGCRATPASS